MDEQNVKVTQATAGAPAAEDKNKARHQRRGGRSQRHHGGNVRSEKKPNIAETAAQDATAAARTADGRQKNTPVKTHADGGKNAAGANGNNGGVRRSGNNGGPKQQRRATRTDADNSGNDKNNANVNSDPNANDQGVGAESRDGSRRSQKQSGNARRDRAESNDVRARRDTLQKDTFGDNFADISLTGNSRQPVLIGTEEDDYSDIAAMPDAFRIPDEDILPECMLPSQNGTPRSTLAHTPRDGKTEVVGVKFESSGKSYYFAPGADQFRRGDHAIVETARGMEYGEISMGNTFVPTEDIVQPLRAIGRRATEEDSRHDEENHRREKEALVICAEKIAARGLDMKLVDAGYTFDNSKLIFYFTAAGRVDFRELVKDLASVFRTRIELRQIGIRDEAKMLGGCGVCGRKLCCSSFLPNFNQVSIRMAKEQGLSLSSSKISGCCGRLMCCLRFEHDTYEREIRMTPPIDSIVETEDGRGIVTENSPIAGTVKVRLDDKPGDPPRIYHRDSVKVITRGQRRVDTSDASDDADVIPED